MITDYSQSFPGPILVPCDLLILMALHTRRGKVLSAQEYFSNFKIPTGIVTYIRGLSGKHLSFSVTGFFGKSTMTYEGIALGVENQNKVT